MAFSFLDLHPERGLCEEAVVLARLIDFGVVCVCVREPVVLFHVHYLCQIEYDINTAFAMHWLPAFALWPATEKETKELHRAHAWIV